ncbi:biotin/lipoyl-containing protein, partial [Curtobacterium sp. MCLR17_057]
MSESVNLPALGESVTEGTVTRWLKNVGDRVEVDEPLLEVSTDKVDTEIPSPIAGVVEEILVPEDETVEVGTALVKIGDGSGSSDGGSDSSDSGADDANAAAADAEEPEAAPSTEQEAETPAPEPTEPEPAPAGQT